MPIDTRVPTGISVNDTFTASSGSTRWEMVDDPVGSPDDDTSYIYNNTAAVKIFRGTFAAFAVPAGATISKVSVTARVKNHTGTGTFNVRLFVNGTLYTHGTSETGSSSYGDFTRSWTVNPNTGVAWTVNDVNGTGANPLTAFEIRNAVPTAEQRITQVYISVEYTLPPAMAPQMMAFD